VASNGEQVSRIKNLLAPRQTTTLKPQAAGGRRQAAGGRRQAAGGKYSEFHFGKVN